MLPINFAVRLFLFCLWLAPAALAQPAKPAAAKSANQWALLIGINDYPGEIQDLRFARDDARALKEVLISSAGFQEDHIRLLTDDGLGEAKATKQNILNSIEQTLAPRVEANDQVIVFLAGHGIVRGVGPEAKSYFLPIDIAPQTPESLEHSALDLEELARKLSALKASQFTIFVDACREDPFPGRGLKGNQLTDVMTRGLRIRRLNVASAPQAAQPEAPTSVIFYACRIGERAYENPQLQHGVFTHFIMRGLRELAARPDGRVEAGLLAGYLRDNVKKWRAEAAQTNAIFGEQTPTMIATEVRGPVVVAYVTPMGGATTNATNAQNALSGVTLITEPAGATIFVNGQAAGSGPLFQELAPRDYTVRAELAGFQPVESKIKLVAGYQQEITLTLQPTLANANYEKGVAFENQQLWPQAIAAYEVALREDPTSLATYERLANVYALNARWREAITLLSSALLKFPNNALLLAQRSRAYSAMAESEVTTTTTTPVVTNSFVQPAVSDEPSSSKKSKKGGKGKKDESASAEKSGKGKKEEVASADIGKKGTSKGSKKSKKDDKQAEEEAPRVIASTPAANPPRVNSSFYELALRDAEAAVRLDARLVAAHLALGFAYLFGAHDANRALNAFVAASTLAPSEAEAYYGVGAAYRLMNQAQQALPQLRKAVELRPDFYEAQRELAYCYHARGETDQAIQQYQIASARRSKIKKSDELAANDLALASLYQRKGEQVGGAQGEEYKKAAKAYEKDAREKEPSLKGATKKLAVAGVSKLVEEKVSFEVQNLFGKSKNETPTSSSSSSSGSSSGVSIDKGGVTIPIKVGKLPVKVPVKIPVKIPILGGGKETKVEKGSSKGKKPEGVKIPILIPGKITLPGKSKAPASSSGKDKGSSSSSSSSERGKSAEKEKAPVKIVIPEKLKLPVKP